MADTRKRRSSDALRARAPTNQSERFIEAARELGCDEDPEAFKRVVQKLAKAPPTLRKRVKKDSAEE